MVKVSSSLPSHFTKVTSRPPLVALRISVNMLNMDQRYAVLSRNLHNMESTLFAIILYYWDILTFTLDYTQLKEELNLQRLMVSVFIFENRCCYFCHYLVWAQIQFLTGLDFLWRSQSVISISLSNLIGISILKWFFCSPLFMYNDIWATQINQTVQMSIDLQASYGGSYVAMECYGNQLPSCTVLLTS